VSTPQDDRWPPSVIGALACLAAFVALRGQDLQILADRGLWGVMVASIAVPALFAVGIARGDRLAWRWGRWLGIGGAAGLLAAAALARPLVALAVARGFPDPRLNFSTTWSVRLVALAATLGTLVLLLSRKSAAAHFRLDCPQCGRNEARAADPLFRRARCASCGATF